MNYDQQVQQSLSMSALRPASRMKSQGSNTSNRTRKRTTHKSKQEAKLRENMWNDPYSPFFKDLACENVIKAEKDQPSPMSSQLSESISVAHFPELPAEDPNMVEEEKRQLASKYLPSVSQRQSTLDSKRLFVAPDLMAQALRNADDKFRIEKNQALNRLTSECNSAMDEKIVEIHALFDEQMQRKEIEMQAEIEQNTRNVEAQKTEALRQRTEDLRLEKEQALAALSAEKNQKTEQMLAATEKRLADEHNIVFQKLEEDAEQDAQKRVKEEETRVTTKLQAENAACTEALQKQMNAKMAETIEKFKLQFDVEKLQLVAETTLTTMRAHQLDVDTIRLNEAQKVTIEVSKRMGENQDLMLKHIKDNHDKTLDAKEAEFRTLNQEMLQTMDKLEASVKKADSLDKECTRLGGELDRQTHALRTALASQTQKLAELTKEFDAMVRENTTKQAHIEMIQIKLVEEQNGHSKTKSALEKLEGEHMNLKQKMMEELQNRRLAEKVFEDRITALEIGKSAMQGDLDTKEKTIIRLQERMEELEKISLEGEKQQQNLLQQIQESSAVVQSKMTLPVISDSEEELAKRAHTDPSESEMTESDAGNPSGQRGRAGEVQGSAYTVSLSEGATGLDLQQVDGRILVKAATGQASSSGVRSGDELLGIAGVAVANGMQLADAVNNLESAPRPLTLKMMH